jgi:hypothetical protein
METTIETTTAKINTRPVKDFIKAEVEKQKIYKDQRKMVRNKLERTIEPKDAQYKAYYQSFELRIFYAAYALLRGKSLKDAEFNYDENDPNNFLNCRKLKIAKTLEGFKHMSGIKE